jgi:hypothetical protein
MIYYSYELKAVLRAVSKSGQGIPNSQILKLATIFNVGIRKI